MTESSQKRNLPTKSRQYRMENNGAAEGVLFIIANGHQVEGPQWL